MISLKTIIESTLLNKRLYGENRLKFAFQIEPALHYLLENVAFHFSSDKTEIRELHSSRQLLDFVREQELIKSDLIDEIDHLLIISQQVKRLPFSQSDQAQETEALLNNADQYLLQIKMIVEELISSLEET